jgi:two-component system OmpR family sensor kinase
MTGLPSIHRRLSSALVVVAFAWGVAVAATVGLVVHHAVNELLDSALHESAEVLQDLLAYNPGQLPLSGGVLPGPPHQERVVWQIVGARDEVLFRSYQAPARPLNTGLTAGFADQGEDWRVFGMRFDGQDRVLYVAQRAQERRAARMDAIKLLVPAALLVGLLGAYWMRVRVRHELRTITALSCAVKEFDPLKPGSLLIDAARTELVPMHHAITELGGRLARRVATERAFVAHAAHALRTPLATMAANLAVAQRRAGPDERAQLQRTRDAADRLRRVVSALLTMFRSGGEAERQTVNLDDLAAQLPFEELDLQIEPDASVNVDPDLLAAALMNLLDNAQRHGATAVEFKVSREAGGLTRLVLRDNGSGMADADRQRLQAALDRQDYDNLTGLGLMLADLVARAHEGRLLLLPALPGRPGCGVEVSLRAAG